jgi:hypothetical protein
MRVFLILMKMKIHFLSNHQDFIFLLTSLKNNTMEIFHSEALVKDQTPCRMKSNRLNLRGFIVNIMNSNSQKSGDLTKKIKFTCLMTKSTFLMSPQLMM